MQVEDIDLHPHAERFLKRKNATKDWSESTLGIRERNLRYFLEWADEQGYDFIEMTGMQIEDHLIALKNDGYAPNSIAMRYDTLQMFYRYLADEADILDENPMADVERTQMMEGTKKHDTELVYVTPEEKETLVEHASGIRDRLLIRLLWQTGIRQGEAANIKLSDLDRDERSIKIRESKTDAGKRTVFYQERLDWLLKQWLDQGYRDSFQSAPESPYLFVSQRKEKLGPGNIGKIVVKAAKDAGIQEVIYRDAADRPVYRITSHSLRHGHAMALLDEGAPLKWIQEHLGHADIETTTSVYLQPTNSDLGDAMQKYGDAL